MAGIAFTLLVRDKVTRNPIADATVNAVAPGYTPLSFGGSTDARGQLNFVPADNIPAGTYNFNITASGYSSALGHPFSIANGLVLIFELTKTADIAIAFTILLRDAATNDPIMNATVKGVLLGSTPGGFSGITDIGGQVNFVPADNIRAGNYYIVITAAGYFSVSGRPLTIANGVVYTIDLPKTAGGAAQGALLVTDLSTGTPITGAQCAIKGTSWSGLTDSSGKFYYTLAAGTYHFSATATGYSPVTDGSITVPTYSGTMLVFGVGLTPVQTPPPLPPPPGGGANVTVNVANVTSGKSASGGGSVDVNPGDIFQVTGNVSPSPAGGCTGCVDIRVVTGVTIGSIGMVGLNPDGSYLYGPSPVPNTTPFTLVAVYTPTNMNSLPVTVNVIQPLPPPPNTAIPVTIFIAQPISVLNSKKQAVPNATVKISTADGGYVGTFVTNASGDVDTKLNAGFYNIDVAAPGFSPGGASINVTESSASFEIDITSLTPPPIPPPPDGLPPASQNWLIISAVVIILILAAAFTLGGKR